LSLQAPPPASARASRERYILSMKPTTLASRPSSPSAQKSTPSTTAGPAAGPSDHEKRALPLWQSTFEVRA